MPKKTTVAEYLAAQIDVCGKSQKQIAAEAGFPKANVLTMMKQGHTRIPIARVPALARSLGIDPPKFLRLVLAEYHPEMLEVIEEPLGKLPKSN